MAIECGVGVGKGGGGKICQTPPVFPQRQTEQKRLLHFLSYTHQYILYPINQSKFHARCTVAEPSNPLYIYSNIPSPYPRPELVLSLN